jgi:hypothetical protein
MILHQSDAAAASPRWVETRSAAVEINRTLPE